LSPAPETLGTPRQRIERMLALALTTCCLERERLAAIAPDPQVLQTRQVAAWLMVRRAGLATADAAAALGVSTEFVNLAVFTARQRIAAEGLRLDGPLEEIAPAIARIFSPRDDIPAAEPATGPEIMAAVLGAFHVSQQLLTAPGRNRDGARARQAFAWLAANLAAAEAKRIGSWVNRERSSVFSAIAKINTLPGSAGLRREIVACLAAGKPTPAALAGFATALERMTAPSPNPDMRG
jgi:hypothetical protein